MIDKSPPPPSSASLGIRVLPAPRSPPGTLPAGESAERSYSFVRVVRTLSCRPESSRESPSPSCVRARRSLGAFSLQSSS
eukprot:1193558-Prorocentrum_minimum.AAC.1